MNKFLLLLGPSGSGKSAAMQKLREMDERFVYISPYITRPLRPNETDKVSVSGVELDRLVEDGQILTVNDLFGVRYATPRETIETAFADGKFPLLDWPIEKLGIMQSAFPGRIFTVYVEPPSIETWRGWLADGRDTDGGRFEKGMIELKKLWAGEYESLIDFHLVNRGIVTWMAEEIFRRYCDAVR